MEMGFNTGVIIASLLLLTFCVFLEVKRINKHWLAARIVGNSLLISSLALIAIPIFYQHQATQSKNVLTLLTRGTYLDSLSKIREKKYYTDPSLHQVLKGKASFLPDLAYHLAENPSIHSLQVYGYGLSAEELKKLKGMPLNFHPAASPSGLINCSWNGQLRQEEVLSVQGSYHNNRKTTILLKLEGFGSTLDTVTIAPNATQDFSLTHQIRQNGKALLQLIALAGRDTLAKELIPIQSIAKTPVQALILTSFPSFEYKFLKNWLYEQSYPVAFRSRISKDKFSTDFLNRAPINIAHLSTKQLQKEEVLMIDQEEFESSALGTRTTLMQAVEKGLGLIIWLDEPKANGSLAKLISPIENVNTSKALQLSLNQQQQGLASLDLSLKWHLKPKKGQQTLVNDQQGRTIALAALYGEGKIVYTTLTNSHQWLLNGQQEAYAHYWTALINAAARKQSAKISLNTSHPFPTVNEKLSLNLATGDTTIPTVDYERAQLTVHQNLLFPNQWQVQIWPLQAGWQSLHINKVAKDFYVFDKQAWQSVKMAQTLQNNLAYSSKATTQAISSSTNETTSRKEVSKWWFFTILVLSASFLWFEKRNYAKN